MAEVGYGSDVWAGDSIITGRFSRGPMHVVLAFYRRLITPQGTLRPLDEESNEDELDYGFDLAQYCGAVSPEIAVLTAPLRIQAELRKDDRALDVVASGRYAYKSDGTADLFFEVAGVLHGAGERFGFTVKVADLTASLLLGGAST
jgi:hypothetical protein